jgi:prepilin-type N-terminal cleavage/methylation domain-containing protein
MKLRPRQRERAPRPAESGVTLIEMMIAILVLTIGLVAVAQLFVAATMNNSFVVANAGALNDAQRLIERFKYIAANDGTLHVGNAAITSSMYNEGTQQCDAFVNNVPGYNSANSGYKESVWVIRSDGTAVGSPSPANPDGYAALELKAPTLGTRLVYVQMVPKIPDPRTNQTINLMAVIGEK